MFLNCHLKKGVTDGRVLYITVKTVDLYTKDTTWWTLSVV